MTAPQKPHKRRTAKKQAVIAFVTDAGKTTQIMGGYAERVPRPLSITEQIKKSQGDTLNYENNIRH